MVTEDVSEAYKAYVFYMELILDEILVTALLRDEEVAKVL